MKAATHHQEQARLAALRRYEILDTPREQDFDDVVALAARLCGTAIAVINLIDADRQWFKAETGLGVRETPLDTSICAHVILHDAFVEIPDTLADPRLADNPLCTGDPGLRFYAGGLLRSPDGLPIGTLCVLDHQPRVLDETQREVLRVLADQVMAQLNLRSQLAHSAILQSEMDHRVKNSLQTVSAFVALERSTAETDESRDALGRVAQQINTVAVLHEQLGATNAGGTVNLEEYLSRVTSLLDRATPNVTVVGEFSSQRADAREAAVLGTIVNELVANAVKHSFGDASGTIRLCGRMDGDSSFRLTCTDDGPGAPVPKSEHASRREGLGLAIIRASARQLCGSVSSHLAPSGYRSELVCRLS